MRLCITRKILKWTAICVCTIAVPVALVAQFQGTKIQPWIAALLFANLAWVWMMVGNKK